MVDENCINISLRVDECYSKVVVGFNCLFGFLFWVVGDVKS